MIIKKEKKNNVMIYIVDKDYDNEKLHKNILSKKLKRNNVKYIINHNADVYTKEGKLLLCFRKNKLSEKKINTFFDNIINFATKNYTTNRGIASGDLINTPKIMSNILGYFDTFGPAQKYSYKLQGIKLPKILVRETRFLLEEPDNFKNNIVPLVKEIDQCYKKYLPEYYKKQKKKANETPFHISNTSFTTITTNVNFQTAVHADKGDDSEGFGNLVVIEKGKYKGGETCFPQYGIGVDVRNNDILFMDVHQPHGNLPIILEDPNAYRLSIVCYLRLNIWLKTRGISKKQMEKHIKTIKKVLEHNKNKTKKNKK